MYKYGSYEYIVNSLNINQPFKDKIIEKLDLCFKHKDELKFTEIWLFGSCARGEPRVGSDVDILLLTEDLPTREQKCLISQYDIDDTDPDAIIESDIILRAKETIYSDTVPFNRIVRNTKIVLYKEEIHNV